MGQTRDTDSRHPTGSAVPFRYWWGLSSVGLLMALVLLLGPYSDGSEFAPDRGDFWYLWQLAEPSVWTRLSAWLPYAVHQLAMWYLIANARSSRPRYIFGLHHFNVWALGINAFFILLHIVQTKVFYDGLAQDVHEATAMMSVILMLLLILLMENKRRGLFFGKGVSGLNSVGDTVRRYHGYYFSWAITYTFWYHPIELTSGHIAGLAYMMLLMMQGSLFFTRFHTNRWWTMFLESLFVIHGAIVAWYLMNPGEHWAWSMFLFGGMGIFMITQMHGLGLSLRGKIMISTPLIASMVAFYSFFPELVMGVTRLPLIMYLGTFIMFVLVWLMIRFARLLGARPAELPGELSRRAV